MVPEPCGATARRHARNGTEEGYETSCGLGLCPPADSALRLSGDLDGHGGLLLSDPSDPSASAFHPFLPSSHSSDLLRGLWGPGLLASLWPAPFHYLKPAHYRVLWILCPRSSPKSGHFSVPTASFLIAASIHTRPALQPSSAHSLHLDWKRLLWFCCCREECSSVASPFLCYKDQTLPPMHQPFTAWSPRPPAHLSQCLPRMLRHSPTGIKTTGGAC